MICARSEVGLSRLPVTEEIAGSNPVERATDIFTLIGCFFMKKYVTLIAFIYKLCYDIANWTRKSKEFYNKIPDNVRERTPSIMVYDPNKINNPSGSKLDKGLTRRGFGALAVIAFAEGVASACSAKKAPEAKQTTPAPTDESSIGTEPKEPTKSPTPETKEIKINKEAVTKLYEKLNNLKKEFDEASEDERQEKHLRSAIRAAFVEAIESITGYKSTSFDPEAGAWRTSAEDFNKTQDEMMGIVTAGLVLLGNLTLAYHEDQSILPRTSENDLTADGIMGMYLDVFTAGYGRDQIEGFRKTIEENPGAVEALVYKGTLGDGELPKALHISYGLRMKSDDPLANCDRENNPNQCKNVFNQAGEKAPLDGGIHRTVEAVYPTDNHTVLNVMATNIIRVQGTDIRWLNEETNKLGKQWDINKPEEEGLDFYLTPVLVWWDVPDDLYDSMPMYDGQTRKQPRNIPAVGEYMNKVRSSQEAK